MSGVTTAEALEWFKANCPGEAAFDRYLAATLVQKFQDDPNMLERVAVKYPLVQQWIDGEEE